MPAIAGQETADRVAEALGRLAAEAARCERCPLHLNGTRVVFGEGSANASIMMVGEQPGDQEERLGHPFVGPAGQVLDRALAEAGIDRRQLYITNAVKHFKHERQGKRRLHKRPNQGEVQQCRWWLDREIALVRPRLILALGLTAAQALTGRKLVLSQHRGRALEIPDLAAPAMVTAHPSSILRMPDEAARHASFAALVADLEAAARLGL